MSNNDRAYIFGFGISFLLLFSIQLWTSHMPGFAILIAIFALALLVILLRSNLHVRKLFASLRDWITAANYTEWPSSNQTNGALRNPPIDVYRPYNDDALLDESPDLPPAAPLPHALKALKAAHIDQQTLSASLLTDIGFIASWDTVTAHTYRTTPIPDSAHAIQPYAQLRLRHSGLWHIMFEIYDAGGTLLFQRENETYLEQGRHLVMPPARLRLQKALRVGTWTLSVRVNGTLLAEHRFTWSADLVDGFIESDGEIDEEYLHRIEDLPARPVSMDELLSMPTSHAKPRSLPP